MYGIDVAENDGSVNWAEVKNSGKIFAFVKATEGKTLKDGLFSHHWPTIKKYDIARGAYHFFHPRTSQPIDQAHAFLKTVGNLTPGDLPPVLDVETTDNQDVDQEQANIGSTDRNNIINEIKQWLKVVEDAIQQQTGKKIRPIIYTGFNFWQNILGDPHDFADYPLWIAHYGVQTPSIPASWGSGNWLIHQYRGDVPNVPGVSNQADLNRFNSFQLGSKGSIVKGIQQRLKDFKKPEFDPVNVDGHFTSQTEKAVIAFQKSHKLQADGIVGLKTWLQLLWG